MKSIILILMICFSAGYVYSSNYVLLEFKTIDYDSTLNILNELEEKGITPRHIFAPNHAIIETYKLPLSIITDEEKYNIITKDSIESNLLRNQNDLIEKVYLSLLLPLKNYNEKKVEQLYLSDHHGEKEKNKNLTINNNTHITNRLTNQYMIGYIAVGIYLMESTGSQENWWPEAEDTTFMEIVQGLDWLAEEANKRGVKVVWVYPPVDKVSTSYEPINGTRMPSGSDFEWLNDLFLKYTLILGGWDGAYAVANHLRKTYKTNWAIEIAVVMNENDPDHKFTDGTMAYSADSDDSGNSSARSPLMVVGYYNGGWSSYDGLRYVITHEVSHAFGASDEWSGPTCDDANDCGPKDSFLGIANGNCIQCSSYSEECIMKAPNANLMCDYTSGQIGWYDDDGDGVMKPIDQNTGMFMYIQPVSAGDRVVIYYSDYLLRNVISVTNDMLLGSNRDIILWDGSTYDNSYSDWGIYNVGVVGGGEWTEYLNFSSGISILLSDHYFNLDTISYTNVNLYPYIRHTIYDIAGNIYSRPRFDVMTNSNTTIKTNITGYPDGIYRTEVFGWMPDGNVSDISSFYFINYICGDINNDGSAADIEDLNFLVDYQFNDGPLPSHPASADVDCLDGIDIGDIYYLVEYMFNNGPELNCCHNLP